MRTPIITSSLDDTLTLSSIVGIIQTSIQNQFTPVHKQLALLKEKMDSIIGQCQLDFPRLPHSKSSVSHIPMPVKALDTAKGRTDVAPTPTGLSGSGERQLPPPG